MCEYKVTSREFYTINDIDCYLDNMLKEDKEDGIIEILTIESTKNLMLLVLKQ